MRTLIICLGVVALGLAPVTAQVVLTTNNYGYSGPSTSKNVVRGPSGDLFCLSVSEDASANRPLLLQRSVDGGMTWVDDPTTLNDATSGLTGPVSNNPVSACAMAIDSTGLLHVTWGRWATSFTRQYYRNYDPNTSTASAIVDLSAMFGNSTSARSDACAILVDSVDNVWIAMQTNSSWISRLLRSDTPAASTLTFTNLGNISSSASSQQPALAEDAFGRIHATYYRNLAPGQYHHRIYDPMSGWSVETALGNGATAPHDYTGRLAADLFGNVHSLVAVDVGTPTATWKYEYRMWDSVNGWSGPTTLFTATPAQYTGIANDRIATIACDETTGRVYTVYRDLSDAGQLKLAQKGLTDPAFTVITDLTLPSTGLHAYYSPTMRGNLSPAFDRTGTTLDVTWQDRSSGAAPYSLWFQRLDVGVSGASLTLVTPAVIGTTAQVDLLSLADPAQAYLCGFALGSTPGITLADMRVIPLNFDDLLLFSITPGNGIFVNNSGVFDVLGQASVYINVPGLGALVGLTIEAAFVVADPMDPTGIGTISPNLPITIM